MDLINFQCVDMIFMFYIIKAAIANIISLIWRIKHSFISILLNSTDWNTNNGYFSIIQDTYYHSNYVVMFNFVHSFKILL